MTELRWKCRGTSEGEFDIVLLLSQSGGMSVIYMESSNIGVRGSDVVFNRLEQQASAGTCCGATLHS